MLLGPFPISVAVLKEWQGFQLLSSILIDLYWLKNILVKKPHTYSSAVLDVILFWVTNLVKSVCSGRSMPTSAALDVVAKKLNLKFYEVSVLSSCIQGVCPKTQFN
jgi:hypothetical protein